MPSNYNLQPLGYFPLLPAFDRGCIFALISARDTGLACSIRRKILSNFFSPAVLSLIATCYQPHSTCVIGMIIPMSN